MRPLSDHGLLRVWELGQDQHPVERAVTLLAAACPEMSGEELKGISLGERDSLLLTLRELTFGPRLAGYTECPRCRGGLEFSLVVEDLRPPAGERTLGRERTLAMGDFLVRYRLPDSRDLAAAASCEDVPGARALLIRRCVLEAGRGETEVEAETLPDAVIEAVGRHVARDDVMPEVELDLRCPECGHRWPMLLDIAAFFWTEIAVRAKRLLSEVHTLAVAYGWREADILDMSPRRREAYLEMVT